MGSTGTSFNNSLMKRSRVIRRVAESARSMPCAKFDDGNNRQNCLSIATRGGYLFDHSAGILSCALGGNQDCGIDNDAQRLIPVGWVKGLAVGVDGRMDLDRKIFVNSCGGVCRKRR